MSGIDVYWYIFYLLESGNSNIILLPILILIINGLYAKYTFFLKVQTVFGSWISTEAFFALGLKQRKYKCSVTFCLFFFFSV